MSQWTCESSANFTEAPLIVDQLSSGSIWCSNSSGQLSRFPKELFQSAVVVITNRPTVLESSEVSPDRLLIPRRPLGFTVTLLKVNHSEKSAVVIGYCENQPMMAVASLASSSPFIGKKEIYMFTCTQGDFVFGRKGRTIQQVSWFPSEDPKYFAVLSGNCFVIYNSVAIGIPYATYRLHISYPRSYEPRTSRSNVVAFSFFHKTVNWSAFAVCFLCNNGSVFLLCPVVVPGIRFLKTDAKNLVSESTADSIMNWHKTVFSRTLMNLQSESKEKEQSNLFIETRGLPEDWDIQPALQGPLNKTLGENCDNFHTLMIPEDQKNLITANMDGYLQYYAFKAGVFPSLPIRQNSSKPPHKFVQQDCYLCEALTHIELLKHVQLSHESMTDVLLRSTGDENMITLVSKRIVSNVWLPSLAISSKESVCFSMPLQQGVLGIVTNGGRVFSLMPVNSLQVKLVELDSNISMPEIKSQLSSLEEIIKDLDNTNTDIEEISLEKIQSLKEETRSVISDFSDLFSEQKEMTSNTIYGLDELCLNLKQMMGRAKSSNSNFSISLLGTKYQNILNQLFLLKSKLRFKDLHSFKNSLLHKEVKKN